MGIINPTLIGGIKEMLFNAGGGVYNSLALFLM